MGYLHSYCDGSDYDYVTFLDSFYDVYVNRFDVYNVVDVNYWFEPMVGLPLVITTSIMPQGEEKMDNVHFHASAGIV